MGGGVGLLSVCDYVVIKQAAMLALSEVWATIVPDTVARARAHIPPARAQPSLAPAPHCSRLTAAHSTGEARCDPGNNLAIRGRTDRWGAGPPPLHHRRGDPRRAGEGTAPAALAPLAPPQPCCPCPVAPGVWPLPWSWSLFRLWHLYYETCTAHSGGLPTASTSRLPGPMCPASLFPLPNRAALSPLFLPETAGSRDGPGGRDGRVRRRDGAGRAPDPAHHAVGRPRRSGGRQGPGAARGLLWPVGPSAHRPHGRGARARTADGRVRGRDARRAGQGEASVGGDAAEGVGQGGEQARPSDGLVAHARGGGIYGLLADGARICPAPTVLQHVVLVQLVVGGCAWRGNRSMAAARGVAASCGLARLALVVQPWLPCSFAAPACIDCIAARLAES
eukprot:scaffold1046_cov118-Isochrysis_galbana.AAC.12